MSIKCHDIVGIDNADTLNWSEVAAKRLARLVESEHAHSELQQLVERLRGEHFQLLAALHERTRRVNELEQQLKIRDAELGSLRPMAESWWGSVWRFAQWVRKGSSWQALGKRLIKRLLKLMASIRVLRRLVGKMLRITPRLRARLLAMIELN